MIFPDSLRISMRQYFFVAAVSWTVLIIGSCFWSLWLEKNDIRQQATIEARADLDKDLLYRRWAAGHGGVYVPSTRETPPNPYLAHLKERDISTPSGRPLTLVNPAYMTRQVQTLAQKEYGVQGHITSLKPLRPGNAPDPWEREALQRIAQGDSEVISVAQMRGEPYLRMIRRLRTEKPCLQCHAVQGYKEGDVRGGISVSVPMAPYLAIHAEHSRETVFTYVLIWLVGMTGLLFVGRSFSRQMRQQAELEEGRRRDEERLYLSQVSLDSASDCVFWIDEEARFRMVNETACQRFGYSSEEFSALRVFDVDPSFPQEKWPEHWQELMTRGSMIIETVHRARDGAEFPVEVSTNRIAYGDVIYNCAFARDISERKRAEEMLRKNAAELNEAQRLAHIGSWELDLQSNALKWSEEIFRIFELDPAEFTPSYEAFLAAIHPDDREKVNRAYLASLEDKKTYSIMHRLLMPDGRIKYVHEQCVSVFAEDGAPLRSSGTVQDVSERMQAEHALRKASREWSAAMDASDDVVYLLDLDCHIIRANKAFYRATGTSQDSVVGRHIVQIVHPGGEPVPCPVCRAQEERRDLRLIMEADNPDNPLGRPLEIFVKIVRDQDGHPLSILMNLHDLTAVRQELEEKARIEKQLQQAQKMEAIGTLAGGIAHDFNNILTPILGYTEMALASVPPGDRTASELKEVLKAGKRAAELVRQILAFSRQGDQQLQPMKVQSIIKEALKLLRASIPTSVEFRTRIDPECGAVLATPTQIHQIIMNLCTNASHAMRETGGVLGVTLSQVELDPRDIINKEVVIPGQYAMIEVSDTGHGMGRAVLERIFEPYFTTKGKGEGTGLGLAVVHGIVKNLAGEITVYSEPDKGTTFHIYLPVLETDVSGEGAEMVGALPGGSERILVVDDEEVVVRMTRDILGGLGYQVSGFTAPEEALSAFRAQPQAFDLVLTDMTMPKISGDRLAREVLAIRPEIPVIICTGFSELLSEEKAKALGVRKLIMKPVLLRELARSIREGLEMQKN